MHQKIKKLLLNNYIYVVGFIIFFASTAHFSYPAILTQELLISAIGGSLAIAYFCTQHSLEEKRFARELFAEFNSRYGKINDALFDIKHETANLKKEEMKVLDDYFNLCAEEWLQYTSGIIDLPIWKSWQNGMKAFYSIPRIKNYWDEELASNSYYGFNVTCLS